MLLANPDVLHCLRVLLSWAVPKGPSLDPNDKRLAMHTEDHPVEYGGFEGIIPKGEYGGGTVMVWDQGTWTPIGDPRGGHRKGKLKFQLHGKKLHGIWPLARSYGGKYKAENAWLLIKEDDEFAVPAEVERITEQRTKSALSGRTLDEIAAEKDSVWHSNRNAADNLKAAKKLP